MPSEKDGPEYTLAETIAELDGWTQRRSRMDPVAVANSAAYWLSTAPVKFEGMKAGFSMNGTLTALVEWLAGDSPSLPDAVGFAALYWLRCVQPPPSGGG